LAEPSLTGLWLLFVSETIHVLVVLCSAWYWTGVLCMCVCLYVCVCVGECVVVGSAVYTVWSSLLLVVLHAEVSCNRSETMGNCSGGLWTMSSKRWLLVTSVEYEYYILAECYIAYRLVKLWRTSFYWIVILFHIF